MKHWPTIRGGLLKFPSHKLTYSEIGSVRIGSLEFSYVSSSLKPHTNHLSHKDA